MISLEDVAKECAQTYGRRVEYVEIWEVMHRNGLRDESGDLADRVYELVQGAEIRVKIRSY